jgi:calcineurin-like phosphoesterase family protein
MTERFFCADPHFGHKGMIMFVVGGKPVRPWGIPIGREKFEDLAPEVQTDIMRRVEEMDEAMVENWNRVVGPKDKVEVLGDVIIGRTQRHTLGRLNGRKRLRMGNHDIFIKHNNRDYAEHFEEITAYKVFDDLICSHIPLHPASVKERWKANVHGHLHTGRVMKTMTEVTGYGPSRIETEVKIIDPNYLCVSMEHIDFTPITMEEVYRRIAEQQEKHRG